MVKYHTGDISHGTSAVCWYGREQRRIIYESKHVEVGGRVGGWMDGWMEAWKGGWVDEYMIN